MISESLFADNSEKYKDLIPKELEAHIPIYRDIIELISQIQNKLQKNFYRVTDLEKLKVAVSNGKIKPAKYSIIEEDGIGEYKLVKFSDFFVEDFKKVISLLRKIDKDLKPGKYKEYINSLINAYQNNNFIDPYKKWVQLSPEDYPVDFIILPTEPDLEKVFNSILSFDASLRVPAPKFLNYGQEDYLNYLINSVKSLPKLSEIHYGFNDDELRMNIRVDYSIFSSGVHFIRRFYGQNLPNEREFLVNWGSKIVIYKDVVDANAQNGTKETANEVFEKFTLTDEEFTIASGEKLLAHEVIEALMKFQGSEDRLGNMFLKVREMNAEMSGVNNYVLYLLKHAESDRKIHNLASSYLVSAFDYYKRKHAPENRSPHYYGYVAAVNYLAEKGVVKLNEDNKINPSIKDMLKCISDLSNITTNLLIRGTQEEAKEFFDKYSSEELFKRVLNIK